MMEEHIPAPELARVQLGYMRLSDSAPLIVAQERGLFAKHGLEVTLNREVSWANLRDKLVAGMLDGAQMLSPLPAMIALGASGVRASLVSALVLSLNGNAITLSAELWQAVRRHCADVDDPVQTAAALARVIRERGPLHRLTFATVHGFSTHVLLLRRWLRGGGIDPDHDVRTIVVPPSQMVDSLVHEVIDGYCVGEPWNSIAVQQGLGAIAAIGSHVAADVPEKVFCVTEAWHERHPHAHAALRLALMEACDWIAEPGNRRATARLLAAPAWLDLPEEQLLPSLTGELCREPGAASVRIDDFHVFGAHLQGFPSRSRIGALVTQCCELLGHPLPPDRIQAVVDRTTRPELFLECAARLHAPALP